MPPAWVRGGMRVVASYCVMVGYGRRLWWWCWWVIRVIRVIRDSPLNNFSNADFSQISVF